MACQDGLGLGEIGVAVFMNEVVRPMDKKRKMNQDRESDRTDPCEYPKRWPKKCRRTSNSFLHAFHRLPISHGPLSVTTALSRKQSNCSRGDDRAARLRIHPATAELRLRPRCS